MVAPYSPRPDAGGTLHLPSPNHIHHADPAAALAKLRRSLSRSPSKGGPAFRLVTSKSASSSPGSPLSPSPRSPHGRAATFDILSFEETTAPSLGAAAAAPSSPLAIPFPPSARKSRASTRHLSPMRAAARSISTRQMSPAKRPLQECTDDGNATTPSSSMESTPGTDGEECASRPADENRTVEKSYSSTEFGRFANHPRGPSKDRRTSYFELGAKSSPLKRSDGSSSLELARLGSPVAKRRSLHGGTFGADFDIFDQEAAFGSSPMERSSSDGQGTSRFSPPTSNRSGESRDRDSLGALSPIPRRTSSLRKATFQQRHEKPSFVKSRPNQDLAFELHLSGQLGPSRHRQRPTLENGNPTISRDGPFSVNGALPSASLHPLPSSHKDQSTTMIPVEKDALLPQRHPLSRTITQSSSGSSLQDDSPSHNAVRNFQNAKHNHDFSRSLPLGALRPHNKLNQPDSQSSQASSFATPENYKLAKPLPAAFMSTGLISKRNNHLNDEQLDLQGGVGTMPDTPCKRPSSMASLVPVPTPDISARKARHSRHTLHSFGTPSTPFNPHNSRPSIGGLGRGASIFGDSYNNGGISRRGSFLSVEGDDEHKSPSSAFQSQSSADFEIPPTPTKQVAQQADFCRPIGGSFASRTSSQSTQNNSPEYAKNEDDDETKEIDINCKFLSDENSGGGGDDGAGAGAGRDGGASGGGSGKNGEDVEEAETVVERDDSPSTKLRFRGLDAIPSFSSTRFSLLRKLRSPAPLSRTSLSHSLSITPIRGNGNAKSSPLSPASPVLDRRSRSNRMSPHTPGETMLPPDPSGLSISAHGEKTTLPLSHATPQGPSRFLPATPTAPRDSGHGRSTTGFGVSVTPIHQHAPVDVDPSVTARFDKVEVIGNGQFSQVFRVTRRQPVRAAASFSSSSYFSSSFYSSSSSQPAGSAAADSTHEEVFAVKRSKNAYIGPRDRERKLQEVEILRALGRSDHTVSIVDSWENRDHLFIQTEFCEEGSLDLFLNRVGRNWRLDDFRIWKIMLELSLGLKHVHDSGFIHLDLKPANVLITFEGVLKIADFGMATAWPAAAGIEGEGDREYIGPEILMGKYDKPADIFALGLIMLEIAANVMLPDNGASWQRLRSGDMSDVPSLTSSSDVSSVSRDSVGNPIGVDDEVPHVPAEAVGVLTTPTAMRHTRPSAAPTEKTAAADPMTATCSSDRTPTPHIVAASLTPGEKESGARARARTRSGGARAIELLPPRFMVDPSDSQALDAIVRWMISPEPGDRPVVDELLGVSGVRWAETRRRAGATIYEGNWGPADEVLQDDAEMIDV